MIDQGVEIHRALAQAILIEGVFKVTPLFFNDALHDAWENAPGDGRTGDVAARQINFVKAFRPG